MNVQPILPSRTARSSERMVDPEPGSSVLIVIKTLATGGAEALVLSQLESAARLSSNRFEVLLLQGWKDDHVARIEAAGVKVHRFTAAPPLRPWWPLLLFIWCLRGPQRVIHCHSPSAVAITRLAQAFRRLRGQSAPHFYTEHNVWENRHPLVRMLVLLSCRLDSATFACSKGVLDSQPMAIRQRAEVLHHGIDGQRLRELALPRSVARERLGLMAHLDRPVVGMVANFRPEKRHDLAVRAAKKVCEEHPDALFVAIGSGETLSAAESAIAAAGLEEYFSLPGAVDQAAHLMRAFDLLMLCSDREGLPVVIMEAQALGVPFVATDVGGVSELVSHEVNGLLVESGSVTALARAIGRVIARPEERRRMSEQARAAADGLDSDRTTEFLDKCYLGASQ